MNTNFNFTITTEDITVAQKILAVINGSTPATTPTTPEVATPAVETTPAVKTITASDIAGIIGKLGEMSESDLVAVFGSDNNKPYRVIRNLGFEKIASTPDFSYNTVATDVTYDQAVAAIDKIVKDVADGGLSHDEFEDMFNCRTSKKVFENFTLDEIVESLEENDLI